MKKMSTTLGAILLLTSVVCLADFSTDAIDGSVTCKGTGNDAVVRMNGKRTRFTVRGVSEKKRVYDVVKHDSDGDTAVDYTGRLHLSPEGNVAVLSFDDDGDTLTLLDGNGSGTALQPQRFLLSCPSQQ